MKSIKYIAAIILLTMSVQSVQAQFDDLINDGNRQTIKDGMNNEYAEETVKLPCQMYDSDTYFAASGFFRTKAGGHDEGDKDYTLLLNEQLNSLRQQVKQKIGGKYRAIMRDYFDQLDVDGRSSAASHIESAGEQAIDTYLNDTKATCTQRSKTTDEGGYWTIYMGITVNKKDIANAMVKGIEEDRSVPDNIKKEIRQNEAAFRESALKSFSDMGQ